LLDLMRVRKGVTVDELAAELYVTRTTIVNHLRPLMSEGFVRRAGLRRRPRRPSVIYELAPNAAGIFPQLYEDFSDEVLEELSSRKPALIKQIIGGVGKRWIVRDLPIVERLRGGRRLQGALALFSKRGFMPTLASSASGRTLEQHNCPLQRLCGRYPQVPDMIRRWMGALLGTSLRRSACMGKGDHSCAYVLGRAAH
jgi:predicted ArsR family transcriptional regulator